MHHLERYNIEVAYAEHLSMVDNHRISNSHDLNTQCRDKDDFKPDWKDEIED